MRKLLFVSFIGFICCNNKEASTHSIVTDVTEINPKKETRKYSQFHSEAFTYVETNMFNEDYYFLLDLSLHSGKNRFFIYDFKREKIIDKNLVTHGSCDQFEENPKKWEKVKYDVRSDSHCSMSGKYKIGERDYSSWGINVKYWIHGLEETNNTAVNRVVVLHSWNAVANEEIFPKYSPLSWGCPAVSNEFMEKLDTRLKKTQKPVLLWIIN